MADGELTEVDKQRVNLAVAEAEKTTGFEFCVIVGARPQQDARQEAMRTFHKLGMHESPAVMIMVVPSARTLEIVTAATIQSRLSNQSCDDAVAVMTNFFAAGDIVSGLEAGIRHLAGATVPLADDDAARSRADLPNIVDLGDPDS